MAKKNTKKAPTEVVETPEQKAYRELVEGIASNIMQLSRGVAALLNGKLKRRAIVKLIAVSARESERVVEDVLKAIENMEEDWLNKK